jgi:hypothetical protein
MRAAILLLLPLLTACNLLPVRECPTTPAIVEIERRVYVPVPREYTAPLPVAMPADRTVRECREVARERRQQLDVCNEHRAETARLAPPEGPQ